MEFKLYDALSGGSQVGPTQSRTNVTVSEGLFTIPDLNFGSAAFAGHARWLQVAVQCSGDPGYTTLDPRQALTATPYALSLRPGATVSGEVANANSLTVVNSAASGASRAVYGIDYSTGGTGVFGLSAAASGTTYGVYGHADSTNGTGVRGYASPLSGITRGVYGEVNSTAGFGVFGYGPVTGVYGYADATTDTTYGVYGEASSTIGRGVYGYATATTGVSVGVEGRVLSPEGVGVRGYASATTGIGFGMYGATQSPGGIGVAGLAASSSGTNYGLRGESSSTAGYGVYGRAPVYGTYGEATASTGYAYGVYGRSDSASGRGVYGYAGGSGVTYGVRGQATSTQGRGVTGYASSTTGTNYGVWGETASNAGYAGYFVGNVDVNGILSKDGGSFKIDHPLDPANKYLYHSFVESPDMMNIYNGNVTLDENGTAWVELPEWFEALNRDFRYQLTCIGGYAPVYIAQEVRGNRFQIAGGSAGLKVSWQVTGIRHDPWAEAHRIPVEVEKPAGERGTYRHPELYGQPEHMGLNYRPDEPDAVALPDGGGR